MARSAARGWTVAAFFTTALPGGRFHRRGCVSSPMQRPLTQLAVANPPTATPIRKYTSLLSDSPQSGSTVRVEGGGDGDGDGLGDGGGGEGGDDEFGGGGGGGVGGGG